MSGIPSHPITVLARGREIRGWIECTITTSLLDPVSTADLKLPWDREAWDLLQREVVVQVRIGDVVVLTGPRDEVERPEGVDEIHLRARSWVGRLVDESAPSFRWEGQTLTQLIARLAAPWFRKVTLSNARNRKALRGRGRQAVAGTEPVRIDPHPGGKLAEPGQTRWAVIEDLLRQTRMLAWSSGDGRELVVGQPNARQEPQWRFFSPAPGSRRAAESNVIGIGVKRSTADRYSRVVVTGSGAGTDANYGPAVAARYGESRDADGLEGTGGDFIVPKRLVVHEPVRSIADAMATADRELRRRAAHAEVVTVTAPGHGQVVAGQLLTVFAPDTIAHVEDEATGTIGAFLVVGCTYKSSRGSGESTALELLRRGVELST